MKTKKLLGTILALAMLGTALPTMGLQSAKAETLTAADAYFLDFVSSDIGDEEITYDSTPLYDESLEVNGYAYTFEVAEQSGYALIHEAALSVGVFYEVEELSFQGVSPFATCEGLPVYVTFGLYLDYKDGNFYELTTDTVVDAETLTAAAEKGFTYNGGVNFVEDSYTINYSRKEIVTYSIPNDLPKYYGIEETNCANAAGSVLIGYYDQFCENLIPNYQVYLTIGSSFVYKGAGTEVNNVTLDLYDRMGSTSSGTTFSGFQAGMSSYAQSKGYTYSTTSVMSGGYLNFSSYESAIQSGKPVALFLQGYAMAISVTEGSGVDTITSNVATSTHVAVGCGYRCDTYYDANNNVISTQRYYKVSSGLVTYGIAYLNMNAYGQINQAIAVTIQ